MILRPHRRRTSALGVQALRQQALAFARDVAPILADLAGRAITSHRAIAQELNRRGIQTARGHAGGWTDTTVARLRRRLQASA